MSEYDYDDTPRMDEAMTAAVRQASDTSQHQAPRFASLHPQDRAKLDKLERNDTQILTTLRIMGAIAALFAVSALGGVVWAGSSIVTLQARVEAVERLVTTHTHSAGHGPTIAAVAENAAVAREMRAETRAELASINQQLAAIRDVLINDDDRRRRR